MEDKEERERGREEKRNVEIELKWRIQNNENLS